MIAVETLSVPLRTHLVASGRFIGAMPKLLASQSLVKILPVEVPVRPLRFAIFTLKGRTLKSGSRSVHRAPSRLRPLNVIWSIASNQPHPAAILLRSICRHRSPAEARSRSLGCQIGDTPSVRVPPDDLPRMSPSGTERTSRYVRFCAAVVGRADISQHGASGTRRLSILRSSRGRRRACRRLVERFIA